MGTKRSCCCYDHQDGGGQSEEVWSVLAPGGRRPGGLWAHRSREPESGPPFALQPHHARAAQHRDLRAEAGEPLPVPELARLWRSHLGRDAHRLPGGREEAAEENGEGPGAAVDGTPTRTAHGGPLQRGHRENRNLLRPGHLPVPAAGRGLLKRAPDSEEDEDAASLQHPDPGSVLLLLQRHPGARPETGAAAGQSVSSSLPPSPLSPQMNQVKTTVPLPALTCACDQVAVKSANTNMPRRKL